MESKEDVSLKTAVDTIRQRWGADSLRRLGHTPMHAPVERLSTGFPALDTMLAGGIPRGRITRLTGQPCCGMTTLALKIVAAVQALGEPVVFIDRNHVLDLDYAAHCGVSLADLLLVRPQSARQALEIAADVIAAKGAGLIVFGRAMAGQAPPGDASSLLRRIDRALKSTRCAVLVLSSPGSPYDIGLAAHAVLRLSIERTGWVRSMGDITGCEIQATVLKNRSGPEGSTAVFPITFGETNR